MSLGAPSIRDHGSGTLVHLGLSVTSGQLTPPRGESVDLAGTRFVLQCDLRLVPSAAKEGARDLVLRLTANDASDGGVSVVSSTSAKALGDFRGALLDRGVATALDAHPEAVSPVLATLDPSAADGDWLSPRQSACVYQRGSAGSAVISVMIATTERDVADALRFAPEGLGGTAPALALSLPLFARHVLGPAIARSFGTSTSSLEIGSDGAVSCDEKLSLPTVSYADIDFEPRVRTLRATLAHGAVHLAMAGECDLVAGITMSFTASILMKPTIGASGVLTFVPEHEMAFDPDTDIPWYDHLAAGVGGLLGELGLQGVIDLVSSGIEDGIVSGLGTACDLGPIPDVVRWRLARGNRPASCSLDGAFILQFQTPEN